MMLVSNRRHQIERRLSVQSSPSLHPRDALTDAERDALLTTDTLLSLVDVLATIPDPRARHGKRYDLPFLLTCLAAAFLGGYDSTDAASQWCHEHRSLLRQVFGQRRHRTPVGALYRRLLPRLSAAYFEWARASWVLHTRPWTDRAPLALEGKTIGGARTGEERAPHRLSVSTHASDEPVLQVRGDATTNEHPVAHDLLGWVLLTERIITADTLHTTTGFAQTVLDHGGHDVLPVKENQSLLHADLVDFFPDPASTWTEATTVDRQHGRGEERRLRVTTELIPHLTFPGVQQAMAIRRRVRLPGKAREAT